MTGLTSPSAAAMNDPLRDVWTQVAIERDRAQRIQDVLYVAALALANAEKGCRYHGADFGKLGIERGLPRCDSCKQPFRVRKALDAIAALGDL